MKVAVSILKSKYSEEETIKKINETNAEYLHLDVMDGTFVNEVSFEYEHLGEVKKPLQVHLMVSNPFSYIGKYALKNTESIIIHTELTEDIDSLLDIIKSYGLKCGLALNPETQIEKITSYIDKLDYILILTVNPGRGGQKLIKDVLYKLDELNRIRVDKNLQFEIIVDGGVNNENIDLMNNADIVVSGSYVCMNDNFQEQINHLR